MVNIEEVWHALMHELENLRHHVDPQLHKGLDAIGFHAATLKNVAQHEVTVVASGAVKDAEKFVGAEVKTVAENVLKAAQTPAPAAPTSAPTIVEKAN